MPAAVAIDVQVQVDRPLVDVAVTGLGATGGGSGPTNAIIIDPLTSARNVIAPSIDGVVPLTLDPAGSSPGNRALQILKYDDGSVVSHLDDDGGFNLGQIGGSELGSFQVLSVDPGAGNNIFNFRDNGFHVWTTQVGGAGFTHIISNNETDPGDIPITIYGSTTQTVDLLQVRDANTDGRIFGVMKDGTIVSSAHALPASGDLNNSDFALWLDDTIGAPVLNVKMKDSAGTAFNTALGAGGGSNPLTTKGDLYTFSTVNARLAVGTNGQFLQANSAATTGNQWSTLSGDATLATGGALTFATVNSNTGSFGDATHVGQFNVNGKGLITAASSVAITGLSPLTTKGDLFGFSTVNARLPVGSDGQILIADSTATLGVSWQAATSASGAVLKNVGNVVTAFTALQRYVNATVTVSNTTQFALRSARGTSGSPTAIQSGDLVGLLGFSGHDGTAFFASPTADMYAVAAQNYDFASGAYGTDLVFQTTPLSNSAGGAQEVARLTHDGSLTLPHGGYLLGGGSTNQLFNAVAVQPAIEVAGAISVVHNSDGFSELLFIGSNFGGNPATIDLRSTRGTSLTSLAVSHSGDRLGGMHIGGSGSTVMVDCAAFYCYASELFAETAGTITNAGCEWRFLTTPNGSGGGAQALALKIGNDKVLTLYGNLEAASGEIDTTSTIQALTTGGSGIWAKIFWDVPTSGVAGAASLSLRGSGVSAGTWAATDLGTGGCGALSFSGQYDSTFGHVSQGAFLGVFAEGTFTSTSAPARYEFRTSGSGSILPTRRLIIDSTGTLHVTPTIASNLVSAANAAIKADGSLFAGGGLTYSSNQPTAANFSINTSGNMVFSGTLTTASDLLIANGGNLLNITSASTLGQSLTLINDRGVLQPSAGVIGTIVFQAAEDNAHTMANGASIAVNATAAWSSTVHGARLRFSTRANTASATLTQAGIFDQDGTFGVGSNTTGTSNAFFVTSAGAMTALSSALSAAQAGAVESVTQGTVGNPVVSYISTATNDDPTLTAIQYRGTTTNATLTTIGTYSLPASKTTLMDCLITCRRTGGASGTADDGGAFVVRGAFQGGAQIGTTTTTVVGRNIGTITATLTYASNTVTVDVTGAATTNYTWHASIWVTTVGT